MKSFSITLSDLSFLSAQLSVPIITVVRYLPDGTPIYDYKVPPSGYKNPLTGISITEAAPFGKLQAAGTTVEL